MSKRIPYCLFLAAFLVLLSCNKKDGGSLPALDETYQNTDDRPFGGSVAYKLIQQLYPNNTARVKKETIEETWKGIYDTGAIYISISKRFYSSDEDVEAILDFVKSGNDIFLAASVFDQNLTDKIGCSVNYRDEYTNQAQDVMQNTSVSFVPTVVNITDHFQYYYRPFNTYFDKLPTENIRVLGYNAKGQPNSFVYFYGKGRMFIHCEPRAFSNYFLLQKDNYKYLQHLMSLSKTEPQHLYWNDYYTNIKRPRNRSNSNASNNNSPDLFKEVTKVPQLAWAFWLSLILLLLYIVYGIKRKQRIVEKIKPNENTSVSFTETVGRLYLQKKDNKNIADKMVTYFNEFVRNQYFLNTSHVNDEFITTLGRKSGIPKDKVESLYRAINHTQVSTEIDDYQLLSLNQQIQNFYKN